MSVMHLIIGEHSTTDWCASSEYMSLQCTVNYRYLATTAVCTDKMFHHVLILHVSSSIYTWQHAENVINVSNENAVIKIKTRIICSTVHSGPVVS